MKLVHHELERFLISEQAPICEWIIELPELFAKYVQELFSQCSGQEGQFVLSSGEKEVDISKNIEMIFNPFSVDINDKKIINKLYTELEKLAVTEEFFVRTRELMQQVYKFLLELEQGTEHILNIGTELDLSDLFKAANIKHEELEEDYVEKLNRYIKIAASILKIKLIVFVNIRSYLEKEQIESLITEAMRQEVKVLMIESKERSCIKGGSRYIIDIDGCEIF